MKYSMIAIVTVDVASKGAHEYDERALRSFVQRQLDASQKSAGAQLLPAGVTIDAVSVQSCVPFMESHRDSGGHRER